jgi:hypothetical protein
MAATFITKYYFLEQNSLSNNAAFIGIESICKENNSNKRNKTSLLKKKKRINYIVSWLIFIYCQNMECSFYLL